MKSLERNDPFGSAPFCFVSRQGAKVNDLSIFPIDSISNAHPLRDPEKGSRIHEQECGSTSSNEESKFFIHQKYQTGERGQQITTERLVALNIAIF